VDPVLHEDQLCLRGITPQGGQASLKPVIVTEGDDYH